MNENELDYLRQYVVDQVNLGDKERKKQINDDVDWMKKRETLMKKENLGDSSVGSSLFDCNMELYKKDAGYNRRREAVPLSTKVVKGKNSDEDEGFDEDDSEEHEFYEMEGDDMFYLAAPPAFPFGLGKHKVKTAIP